MKAFIQKVPGATWAYHILSAWIAALRYGRPSERMYVIGVTGTKGKTTTVELINTILEAAGKKTALISSLRMKIGDKSVKKPTDNSMPGRGYLQKFLSEALAAGCKYAIIEVTSQGVVQSRHRFINWNAAVWTNLSPEHIDAHGSFENYRNAKWDFLRYAAAKGGKVFLNKDDAHSTLFARPIEASRVVLYSKKGEELARIMPHLTPLAESVGMEQSFLLSDFNLANIAAAIAVANELGVSEKTVADALREFKGVPGRMEFVQWKPFKVIIDYAHTPDSLEAVYKASRDLMTQGQHENNNHRLICVLGAAGGGRDKWKRPEMGKIAAEYCDKIILTDEDPYDEKPEEIASQIAAGFSRASGGPYHTENSERILDRRRAIKKALSFAKYGDVVVMTGKGSEDSIHMAKGEKIAWNEREIVESLLHEEKNGVVS